MKSTEFAEEHLIALSNELESNSEHIKSEVYNILLKIPAGKVSTYGDIAKALGYPKAARLVGQILTAATTARWPMYLRNFKQLLRAAEGGPERRMTNTITSATAR